jgi:hypothetical protein
MCSAGGGCQPASYRFIAIGMSDAEKKARLAEALRANLRRRKAQTRAQHAEGEGAEPAPAPAEPPSDDS